MEKMDFKFPHEKDEEKKDDFEFAVEGEIEDAEVKDDPKKKVEKPDIEIVDDTPPEDRGRTPMKEPPKEFAEDELDKYDESVQKRIKHFTKGYHEERRRAETAEREREEALRIAQSIVEENKKLKGSLDGSQQFMHEQAKKVAASELDDAKRKYKEAYESGDPELVAQAQAELTAASIKVDRINNFRPRPLQPAKDGVQTAERRPEPEVPQRRAPEPRAERWQAENPWYGQNEEMSIFAVGVHTKLVNQGISPRSEEYYEKLDARMRQVFPEEFGLDEKQTDAPPPPAKKSNVAPATRSTAPKKIVLTQTQVNIAKRLGVPLELYALKVAEEQMRK
jgi:hypothetical protein